MANKVDDFIPRQTTKTWREQVKQKSKHLRTMQVRNYLGSISSS